MVKRTNRHTPLSRKGGSIKIQTSCRQKYRTPARGAIPRTHARCEDGCDEGYKMVEDTSPSGDPVFLAIPIGWMCRPMNRTCGFANTPRNVTQVSPQYSGGGNRHFCFYSGGHYRTRSTHITVYDNQSPSEARVDYLVDLGGGFRGP